MLVNGSPNVALAGCSVMVRGACGNTTAAASAVKHAATAVTGAVICMRSVQPVFAARCPLPAACYFGSPFTASFTMYGTPSVIHFGAGAPFR